MGLQDKSTRYAKIVKDPSSLAVPPNLADYHAACADFDWRAARNRLD
jgi:acetyl-CoA synthetase